MASRLNTTPVKSFSSGMRFLFSAASLCAALASTSAFALQYAQSGAGAYANQIGWLDFSGYNYAQALSASGQDFSYPLSGGATLSFNLKQTGVQFNAVASPTFTIYGGAAFGVGSYLNIDSGGTRSVLYAVRGNVTLTLSNIQLLDSANTPSSQFRLISTDAETTTTGEFINWSTNAPILDMIETLPAPGSPTLFNPVTGVGTTSVRETSSVNPPPVAGSFLLAARQPTAGQMPMSMTISMFSGVEAIAVGLALPQINIIKTTPTTTLTPNGTITYSVIVSNNGLVTADGTRVADPIPTGLTSFSWTCTAASGAVCANTTGTGALNELIPTFPIGGSVTYAITAQVSAAPPASVINTSSATPPAGGVCGTAHTAPPCTSIAIVPPVPVISLSKTSSSPVVAPNGTANYTVTAINTSSVAADGTIIADPLPSGIASAAWTCSVTGSAVCPAATGSGPLNEAIATFPAGSSVTYAINAVVSTAPPASITNTATATPPGNGLCAPGNTASPCTSSRIISVVTPPPATPSPVPALSTLLLAMLAVFMAASTALTLRGRLR